MLVFVQKPVEAVMRGKQTRALGERDLPNRTRSFQPLVKCEEVSQYHPVVWAKEPPALAPCFRELTLALLRSCPPFVTKGTHQPGARTLLQGPAALNSLLQGLHSSLLQVWPKGKEKARILILPCGWPRAAVSKVTEGGQSMCAQG